MSELKAYSVCHPPALCIPCFGQNLMWRDYINPHPGSATLPRFHRPGHVPIHPCPCIPESLCIARCSPHFPEHGVEGGHVAMADCEDGLPVCVKDGKAVEGTSLAHCHLPFQHPNPSCRHRNLSALDTSKSPYIEYLHARRSQ